MSWRKTVECIQLYKQRNQRYSESKFFLSNSHNSWSFILQRFISSIGSSFLAIYRISRFLIFFVTRTPLVNSALWRRSLCWWSTKRDVFHQQWPQRELMKFIKRTVPLPGNFNEEYMKIKSRLTPLRRVLGQFCLYYTLHKWMLLW